MTDRLVISIDAMGGDNAPETVIAGVKLAHEKYPDVFFLLYGDEARIEALAEQNGLDKQAYRVYHTTQVIKADEKPSAAVRYGRESSMWKAIYAVRTGEASAVVSAGNTGALMAMSKICLGTMAGVDRPAIAAIMPTSVQGQDVVALDLGANAECNATNLVEFAIMGSVFYRIVYGLQKPSVGLLNIGSEESKGREEIKEAANILKANAEKINYYGFVEGFDIGAGTTHVVVSDGFSGNVALKAIEGTAKMIKRIFGQQMKKSLLAYLGMIFLFPTLLRLKKRVDPRRYNGAMFLGLNGISVKSHGGADELGYFHAVETAINLVQNDFCEKIRVELEEVIFSSEDSFEY
ncbi:MAG: phosphate acyltransferase PlsX [Alphaproteobacteria bacterium]|nr:phosphate acyltransferase PlsX [Alphaproteobacteria bacterium]